MPVPKQIAKQIVKSSDVAASGGAWPHDPLLWPFAAANMALDAYGWWLDRSPDSGRADDEADLPWTTPNTVALELPSMRLRDFSRAREASPVLICAPYTLHGAMVADFAGGHSLVEALHSGGLDRLYLTDWKSASPDMRHLSIDHYLADLNVAVDEIGPPVDLVGLCQGGWLSLVYAARFPQKVRRLVLVGTPVDISVPSDLSRLVAKAPQAAFEGLVGSGGGLVRGDHMLRFWSRPPNIETALQRDLSGGAATELRDRFQRWHERTLDLPGTYYLEVVNWIFRENRLASGGFVALGREIHLEDVRLPTFVLAGADDEVVPAAQALATPGLLGTPSPLIESACVPACHLGLFMGGQTLASSWPRIARWLRSDLPRLRAQGAIVA